MDLKSNKAARQIIADILQTKQLTDTDLENISEFATLCSISEDAVIIRKNQPPQSMYIVVEGTLHVEAESPEYSHPVVLNKLVAGDLFGDISFFTGRLATATVRAATNCLLIEISKDITKPRTKVQHQFYENVEKRILTVNIDRLVVNNETQAKLYTDIIKQQQRLQFAGNLYIFLMTLIFGWVIFQSIMVNIFGGEIFENPWVASTIPLLVALPIIIYATRTGLAWAEVGFTLGDFRRNMREVLVISIVLVASCFAYWFLRYGYADTMSELKSFLVNNKIFPIRYLLHSTFQEILARGFGLGLVLKFYGNKRWFAAVFITSVLFTVYHSYGSSTFIIAVFVFRLLLGFLYVRQRSLLGVILVHYLIGFLQEISIATHLRFY
jgi:membrane protease YdiL (CAAX protease family)